MSSENRSVTRASTVTNAAISFLILKLNQKQKYFLELFVVHDFENDFMQKSTI